MNAKYSMRMSNEAPLAEIPLPGRGAAGTPLPMSIEEMHRRGWDGVDIVFVTGDAYVDHPSFAMAILGRALEAAGYRVGIVSQPNCTLIVAPGLPWIQSQVCGQIWMTVGTSGSS